VVVQGEIRDLILSVFPSYLGDLWKPFLDALFVIFLFLFGFYNPTLLLSR